MIKAKRILRSIFFTVLAIPLSGLIAAQAASADFASNVVLDAQPPIFNVTVPTSLPIRVSADGDVAVSDDIYIVNYSSGAVVVSDIAITGKNGWRTVDASKDLSAMQMDVKEFSMTINNEVTTGADMITFEQSNWPVIAAANDSDSDCLHLVYSAAIVPQSRSINEEIANVVFTIGWNAARDDLVSDPAFEPNGVVTYSDVDQGALGDHNDRNIEYPVSNSMSIYQDVAAGEVYTYKTDSGVYIVGNRYPE